MVKKNHLIVTVLIVVVAAFLGGVFLVNSPAWPQSQVQPKPSQVPYEGQKKETNQPTSSQSTPQEGLLGSPKTVFKGTELIRKKDTIMGLLQGTVKQIVGDEEEGKVYYDVKLFLPRTFQDPPTTYFRQIFTAGPSTEYSKYLVEQEKEVSASASDIKVGNSVILYVKGQASAIKNADRLQLQKVMKEIQ